MYFQEVNVTNAVGLHARPASEFVRKANTFLSKVSIVFKNKEVNAKSIIGILSAGIVTGSTIEIKAEGEDEEKAVISLVEFVKNNFGE